TAMPVKDRPSASARVERRTSCCSVIVGVLVANEALIVEGGARRNDPSVQQIPRPASMFLLDTFAAGASRERHEKKRSRTSAGSGWPVRCARSRTCQKYR